MIINLRLAVIVMDIGDLLGLLFGDDEYYARHCEQCVHNALTAQMHEAFLTRQLSVNSNTTESALNE